LRIALLNFLALSTALGNVASDHGVPARLAIFISQKRQIGRRPKDRSVTAQLLALILKVPIPKRDTKVVQRSVSVASLEEVGQRFA